MNKELKYLSNYLPYDVEFTNKIPIGNTVQKFKLTPHHLIGSDWSKNKLILRPLSFLTKEIEINGIKIIPIIELAKICFYVENLDGFITKENCILKTETKYGNKWSAKFNIPCSQDKYQTYEFWCFESGHSTLEFRFNQFVHGREHGHALNHIIEMICKCYELHLDIDFLIQKEKAIACF